MLLEFLTDKDLQLFKKQKFIEPLLLHSEENNRELRSACRKSHVSLKSDDMKTRTALEREVLL